MSTMRVFVALPVLGEWRQQIIEQTGVFLEAESTHMRPLLPLDYHVTLQFLGNLPAQAVIDMVPVLQTLLPTHPAFDLHWQYMQAFPDANPHCWVMSIEASPALRALQQTVSTALQQLGLSVDTRVYLPHMTLAKKNRQAVMPEVTLPVVELSPMPVKRVLLYQSLQQALGMRYRPLEYFHLG